MWQNIKNFWIFTKIFARKNRLHMFCLVLGGFVMSFLELIGISAILPLLMLIVQPEVAAQGQKIQMLRDMLGVQTPEQMTVILGLCVAGLFIGKNLFQAFYWRFEFRSLAKWRISIIGHFYDSYMRANYETFMQRNSSHMINMLTNVVPSVITNFIHPMLSLVNYLLTGAVILVYIISISWVASALIFIVGAGLMLSYSSFFKKRAIFLGEDAAAMSRQQFALLQQSFGGYKETRAHLKEFYFSKRFMKTADTLAQREEELFFLRSLPPVIVELTAMLLLLIIFLAIFYTGSDVRSTAAQIGVIVLACTRLIPMINRSIYSITAINSTKSLVAELFEEADKVKFNNAIPSAWSSEQPLQEPAALPFHKVLELQDVTYTYPGKRRPALQNVTFSIKPGEFVGITGPSGGGKTTLVNILMGHLNSFEGAFTVDGVPVTQDNIHSFRQIINHVDQQIFMMDTTIAENVAFGVEPDKIDRNKVTEALEKAQLLAHVASLPNGIDTEVGEGGKLLSGGQKQRIAIARAFYRDMKILVLDEASASLDVETEHKLFLFLHSLQGEISVIMIAHRLSTLQNCDRVYFVDQGKIADVGTFESLYHSNEKFKSYIEYSQIKIKDIPVKEEKHD